MVESKMEEYIVAAAAVNLDSLLSNPSTEEMVVEEEEGLTETHYSPTPTRTTTTTLPPYLTG